MTRSRCGAGLVAGVFVHTLAGLLWASSRLRGRYSRSPRSDKRDDTTFVKRHGVDVYTNIVNPSE